MGLTSVTTGDVYSAYLELCNLLSITPATRQWVSETLNQFDIMGIISSTIISRGRYGRTRKINLGAPIDSLKKVLLEGLWSQLILFENNYSLALKAVRRAIYFT